MHQEKRNSILKVKNLSIGYSHKTSTKTIASNIDFHIDSGELVAVIGVNGSGKSTLLRSLSGVQPLLSGEIFIQSQKLAQISSEKMATYISLVLTEQPLSKNLSVFELVALGRQPYTNWIGRLAEKDIKAINNALKMVAIEDLKARKCYELSDGQLQKVLIARALAQDTPLILLDEPTTHLDLFHKAFVFKLLKQLSVETNKAIIFASHEINLALQLCDRLVLIKENKVIDGTPKELVDSGLLQDIFPKNLIYFDKASASFKIKTD